MMNQPKAIRIRFMSIIVMLTRLIEGSESESVYLQEITPQQDSVFAHMNIGEHMYFEMDIEIHAFPANDASYDILQAAVSGGDEIAKISLSTSANGADKYFEFHFLADAIATPVLYSINTDEVFTLQLSAPGNKKTYHLEIGVTQSMVTSSVTDVSAPSNKHEESGTAKTAHSTRTDVPIKLWIPSPSPNRELTVTDLLITSSAIDISNGAFITLWNLPPQIHTEASFEVPEFRPNDASEGSLLTYMDIGDAMRFQMDIEIHAFPPVGDSYLILVGTNANTALEYSADEVWPKIFLRTESSTEKYFEIHFSVEEDRNYQKSTTPIEFPRFPRDAYVTTLLVDQTYELKIDVTQRSMTVDLTDIHWRNTDVWHWKDESKPSHSKALNVPIHGSVPLFIPRPLPPSNQAADVTVQNLFIDTHTFFKASEARVFYKQQPTTAIDTLITHFDVGDVMHFEFDISIKTRPPDSEWRYFMLWQDIAAEANDRFRLGFALAPIADGTKSEIVLLIPNFRGRELHDYHLMNGAPESDGSGYDLNVDYHLEIDLSQMKMEWSVRQTSQTEEEAYEAHEHKHRHKQSSDVKVYGSHSNIAASDYAEFKKHTYGIPADFNVIPDDGAPVAVADVTLRNLKVTSETFQTTTGGGASTNSHPKIYKDFDLDNYGNHHHHHRHQREDQSLLRANPVDVGDVFKSHGSLFIYIIIAVGAVAVFVGVVLRKYRSSNASKLQVGGLSAVGQNAVGDLSDEDIGNYAPESSRDLESGMMDGARKDDEASTQSKEQDVAVSVNAG